MWSSTFARDLKAGGLKARGLKAGGLKTRGLKTTDLDRRQRAGVEAV